MSSGCGLALDDAAVMDRVDGCRRQVDEARQVGGAADGVELAAPLEDLRDGHQVDRLPAIVEVKDRAVDRAVVTAVEVLRAEEVCDLDDRVLVDEQGAEHRLLRFDGLRRKAIDGHAGSMTGKGTNESCPMDEPGATGSSPNVLHDLGDVRSPRWTTCG
jgi:hypothetical protein